MNCLVTGGSRGIGLGIAQALARKGYSVTLAARDRERLRERCAELPLVRAGQKHHSWPLDMRDLKACVNFENAPSPPLDYQHYINCAGVAIPQLLVTQPLKTIEEVLYTNLLGPIALSKTLCKRMLRSKAAHTRHIIFLSSILASQGLAGSTIYSASKAGIVGFAKSLAQEMQSRGVAVNCIAPGLVDTDMGRSASPALMQGKQYVEMADITALCTSILETSTVTGQVFTLDR